MQVSLTGLLGLKPVFLLFSIFQFRIRQDRTRWGPLLIRLSPKVKEEEKEEGEEFQFRIRNCVSIWQPCLGLNWEINIAQFGHTISCLCSLKRILCILFTQGGTQHIDIRGVSPRLL